jgi:hypothetical protein
MSTVLGDDLHRHRSWAVFDALLSAAQLHEAAENLRLAADSGDLDDEPRLTLTIRCDISAFDLALYRAANPRFFVVVDDVHIVRSEN